MVVAGGRVVLENPAHVYAGALHVCSGVCDYVLAQGVLGAAMIQDDSSPRETFQRLGDALGDLITSIRDFGNGILDTPWSDFGALI